MSLSICDPSPPGLASAWPTTASYVVLAVQRLQDWMLETGMPPVKALNISCDLWPDPQHPTAIALDMLEREFDVLVVASASNEGDATSKAAGFVNGLCVGNVHKWSYTLVVPTTRWPHELSARGPLWGDTDRYYPDICATGASGGRDLLGNQVQMPLIDDQYQPVPGNTCRLSGLANFEWYDAAGTSMASPQVSGAATLYRAQRLTATALETKAAILLTTIDPFQHSNAVFTTPTRHTYNDRNATGVGYLRADLLARYSLRFDNALGTSVTLTAAAPTANVTYTGLVEGGRYAVAIAWPRQFESGYNGDPVVDWPNIDLEVRSLAVPQQVLARSDSLRNTYEHLVFATTESSVVVQVRAVGALAQATPVYVAARQVTPVTVNVMGSPVALNSRRSIPGFVTSIDQVVSCGHSASDQNVQRVLPKSYTEAYGSVAFQAASFSGEANENGIPLGASSASPVLENIYAPAQVPGTTPFTVRGLAFRTWAPFTGCSASATVQEVILYQRPPGPNGMVLFQNARPTIGTTVASGISVSLPNPAWSARSYHTWPIIIPFSQSYTVDPSQVLGIWIKWSSGNSCPNSVVYRVDAAEDGSGFGSQYKSYSSLGPILGKAAIIGLVDGSTAFRTARLDVHGFPREGEPVLFQVRQAAPSASIVVHLGLGNPNLLIGDCRELATQDVVASLPLTTSLMGDGAVPFTLPSSGLLHQHVFAQAYFSLGSATMRTNGLRLTIGGIAQ